jgi:hypothetical protein
MRGENDSDHQQAGASATEGSESLLRKDRFYRALASTPRRRLMGYLLEERESSVDDLAGMLVGWEAASNDEPGTEEEYARMRIELQHSHLPLLASVGVIAYDPANETVRIEPLDDQARALVEASVGSGGR